MSTLHLKTVAIATALFAAPTLAFAQASPPPAAPSTPAAPAPAAPAEAKPKAQAPASLANVAEQKKGQWLTSKMIGVDVYNMSNEKVGDITELVITQDGKIDAIVVGVGGFLGMGQHDVAVPFNEVQWVEKPVVTSSTAPSPAAPGASGMGGGGSAGSSDRTATTGSITNSAPAADAPRAYPDHATISMTRDELKAAPAFKYAR